MRAKAKAHVVRGEGRKRYVLPRVGFSVDEGWTEEEVQVAGQRWGPGTFS